MYIYIHRHTHTNVYQPHCMACRILVPRPGIKPAHSKPLHWIWGVLTMELLEVPRFLKVVTETRGATVQSLSGESLSLLCFPYTTHRYGSGQSLFLWPESMLRAGMHVSFTADSGPPGVSKEHALWSPFHGCAWECWWCILWVPPCCWQKGPSSHYSFFVGALLLSGVGKKITQWITD